MVEAYLRQSPLAHLGLDGRAEASRGAAGVTLAERPHRGMVNLRLDPSDETAMNAFAEAFGFALPVAPNTSAGDGAASALWLGPDEWWLVVPGPGPALADKLRAALADGFAAVTEVGESRTCIRIAGPKARALLQKGCPLDLHPRAFAPGACAQTILAKATVAIHLVADESGPTGARPTGASRRAPPSRSTSCAASPNTSGPGSRTRGGSTGLA
ncbi:MAG: sarcosine oxidase subunit gamma [Proteobacteria bacterium]|nr:sarcosine oxidase subunit gamma [Pseudomonadota bacterium]